MIGNILSLALGVTGAHRPVTLSRFTGRAENAAGYDVSTYDAPVVIEGSVQPVPRALYQQLGLNFEKEYVTVYTSARVRTVGRDSAGDKINYLGAEWVCESSTPWGAQAGWAAVVACKVQA